jgi:hypothetical protein
MKDSGTDVDVKGIEKYDPFVNTVLLVVSLIIIISYLLFPDSILIRTFFLLPSILFLALIFFGFWEVGSIVLDCIPSKNEVIKKKAMPVYVCLFLIVLVLILVIGYVTVNSMSNEATISNGTVLGLWRTVDGSIQYNFYQNRTFTLLYNNTDHYGCWANINDTYYLTYQDTITEFENRTTMTCNDNSVMYAQKEPSFYVLKI